jgi:hypothetical protein
MESFGGRARSFEGKSGFVVAVGSWSTQYEGPWRSHHVRVRFGMVGRKGRYVKVIGRLAVSHVRKKSRIVESIA